MQRLFAFLLCTSVSAQALERRCLEEPSQILGRRTQYCVLVPDQSPVAVVYFFHGLSGGARSLWENGYEEVVRARRLPLLVVSFDTSAASFFSDAAAKSFGSRAFESFFVEELVPKIEARYFQKPLQRTHRLLWGVSMGGYGALKTALRHSQLFAAAAANVPALQPFNIHESDVLWWRYFERHPIGGFRGRSLLQYLRSVHTTEDESNFHDPSWLLESFQDRSQRPKLWVDAAGRDYFGFQEGYWRLRSTAERIHWPLEGYFSPHAEHELFWETRWPSFDFLADQVPELIHRRRLGVVTQVDPVRAHTPRMLQ
jgi:S-formylglutathione hydrolase FrmB